MATGDVPDVRDRLKSVLPPGWFSAATPILDGLLTGTATALAAVYALIQYVLLQTRIQTASDGWLDIVALDFFGPTFTRGTYETDAALRTRILANLLPLRVTRQAMIDRLTALTGYRPTVTENWRPEDTGAWNFHGGWSVLGSYASAFAYQAYVLVTRIYQGIPWRGGYNTGLGGWNAAGGISWGTLSEAPGFVSDQSVFDAINATRPFGTIIWTRFAMTLAPPIIPPVPPVPTPAYVGPWGAYTDGTFTYGLGGWSVPSSAMAYQ